MFGNRSKNSLDETIDRLTLLENTTMINLPRIYSLEKRFDDMCKKIEALENRAEREQQSRRLLAEREETASPKEDSRPSSNTATPTHADAVAKTAAAVPSHRGVGSEPKARITMLKELVKKATSPPNSVSIPQSVPDQPPTMAEPPRPVIDGTTTRRT